MELWALLCVEAVHPTKTELTLAENALWTKESFCQKLGMLMHLLPLSQDTLCEELRDFRELKGKPLQRLQPGRVLLPKNGNSHEADAGSVCHSSLEGVTLAFLLKTKQSNKTKQNKNKSWF